MIKKFEHFTNIQKKAVKTKDGKEIKEGEIYWLYNKKTNESDKVKCIRILDNGGVDFYIYNNSGGDRVSIVNTDLVKIYSYEGGRSLPQDPVLKLSIINYLKELGLIVTSIKCNKRNGVVKFEFENNIYKSKWCEKEDGVEITVFGENKKIVWENISIFDIQKICQRIKFISCEWPK